MSTPKVHFNLPPNPHRAQPRKLNRTSDGDTPVIEQPIRMVSCDTPEKGGYAGNPPVSQPKLNECKQRLTSTFYSAIPKKLRDYLVQKLTADAAQRHIAAGLDATSEFERLQNLRLTKTDGSKRSVAVIPTGEVIDRYGRLLAYLAPWYSGTTKDPLPPIGDPARDTFNLDMIANGWAAFFPIYPSLPKDAEMNTAIAAAENAWNTQAGAWQSYGKKLLLAYEFRACIKLAAAKTAAAGIKAAFQRVCVDLRNLKIVGKFGFWAVPPCYRLWVWEDDLAKATTELGLVP